MPVMGGVVCSSLGSKSGLRWLTRKEEKGERMILLRNAALMLVLSLGLGACGGEVSSEPVSVDVSMTDDLTYEPGDLVVPVGAEVTINASNVGEIGKHNLLVIDDVFSGEEKIQAKNAMAADPSIVLAQTEDVEPGNSESVVVTFTEPGVYQFFCNIDGHFVNGMHGTITVEG